ncbi:MAG: GspE/PulE family protein [Hydrogenothermaceae bacterium]|nr:GspE/PulE family protein [Hydrogenothermaceae bacterium]
MAKLPIGELLKKFGYINEKQLEFTAKIKKIHQNKFFGEILKDLYFVSSMEIAKALSLQSGKEYIDLNEVYPSKEALYLVPQDIATQYKLLPLSVEEGKITVAISDPYNIIAVDILKKRLGKEVEIFVAEEEKILRYIQIYYFLLENPTEKKYESLIGRLKTEGVNTVLPELVDFTLSESIIQRASDIHISPQFLSTDVFVRVDGVMKHLFSFPKEIHQSIVSRIKVLSNLNIAEQRLPQDGSFSYTFMGGTYDFRVSTVPSSFGENIVLRILSKNLSLFSLNNLGLRDFQIEIINSLIRKTQGIFLITGPTGSGKTTTLYSILRKINALEKNIITVEDPIEYKFPFIKQTQVSDKIGFTFSAAVRAFLRQDPDVILIGEIRDEETAEIAIKSSITGHLVLSTLHTNSSISAIPRLLDLKVKPFMIASSLVAVSAQRLVRKLCPFCKEKREFSFDALVKIGFKPESLEKVGVKTSLEGFSSGKGCEKCGGTGYIGRKLLAEIFEIDDEIADMIADNLSITKIYQKAIEKGMKTIEDVAILDIMDGITSPQEVMRVIA